MKERGILVTGGAGYIGSNVVLALLAAGENVVVIDDLSTGRREAVPNGAVFIEGNIGDRAVLEKIFIQHSIGAILHFAGSILVSESVRDPLKYHINNVVNSLILFETAVRFKVPHVVFSSSAAVYGEPKEHPVSEQSLPSPTNPYGASKLSIEWALRDIAVAHPLCYVALRYFNVAGADPEARAGYNYHVPSMHIIPATVRAALTGKPVTVFGTDYATSDGTCVRDYIHVSDLAHAHIAALEHLRKGGASGIYNCGYGRGFSVLEIINTVKEMSGQEVQVDFAPRRAGDPPMLVADVDKLKRFLSWEPRYNLLKDIIGHELAWARRQLNI